MFPLKSTALAREHGIQGFMASQGPMIRYFARNNLVLEKTSCSQQLWNAYEKKVLCFQKYVT
jgi:hypothetical protein